MGSQHSQCVVCVKTLGLGVFGGMTSSLYGFSCKSFVIPITTWMIIDKPKKVVVKKKKQQSEMDILTRLSDSEYSIHLLGYSSQYMVTELCEGGDLFQFVESHKQIPTPVIYTIIKQLILAVQECHARKVVHVDIKLENIGLCEKKKIKLIDFGSAIYTPDYKKTDTLGATQDYIPPECVIHNKDKTYKIEPDNLVYIDFWEVGIVIYVLLNHRFPFHGNTQKQTFYNILKTECEWNRDVDPTLKELACGLLKKVPTERLNLDTYNVNTELMVKS